MAKYNSLSELFTAIANAIRAKTGGADPIVAEDFPEAVEGISAGGGDIDALLDGSLTEITSNAESVRDYMFSGCTALTSVNLPLATSMGNKTFNGCTALTSVNLPLARSMGSLVFGGCTALTSVNLPSVMRIDTAAFSGCTALTSVNLRPVRTIGPTAFYNCAKLTSVIIRSNTMCALDTITAFNNCYHFHGTVDATYNPDGLKDGYIYVPRALIEDYKVATNWTTLATQFRALEDYTVDGTITGELDESKVNA